MHADLSTELWQCTHRSLRRMHQGQFRKDGRTPYVAHPFRVAMTVRHAFGVDDEVALAALLHDVIEDTAADYDDIAAACGTAVADVVAASPRTCVWQKASANRPTTVSWRLPPGRRLVPGRRLR